MTKELPTGDDVIVHEEKALFEGFHSIVRATLTYPKFDGSDARVVRERVDRGDSAALLLVHKTKRTIILIEQFRYPALREGPAWMLEVPAGVVDRAHDGTHELPIQAALRECIEESGYKASNARFLSTFYTSPGSLSERVHLYWAHVDESAPREARQAYGHASEGEDIRVVEMTVDDFIARALAGAIPDAKTLIAGLWIALRRADIGL